MKTSAIIKLILSVTVVLGFSLSSFAQSEDQNDKPKIKVLSVSKGLRLLQLIDTNNKVYKRYNVSLGSVPVGPKQISGDGKTPEGRYVINYKNPESKFHLALSVSYPNATDRKNAKAQGANPGGDIMIHGLGDYGWVGSAHTLFDWTQGCIAVTNEEIEEIYSLVKEGTPIYIWP